MSYLDHDLILGADLQDPLGGGHADVEGEWRACTQRLLDFCRSTEQVQNKRGGHSRGVVHSLADSYVCSASNGLHQSSARSCVPWGARRQRGATLECARPCPK
ncbi:unnamed protein product [Trichogramma brassicae]|uniref:Uncharacterized protein n=1 Tax=Trichogramma brassicae TaxID=86971 RepID=A0A6H5I0A6_9HYME|nr:unnamed protein product [Trichogramma brassicae]